MEIIRVENLETKEYMEIGVNGLTFEEIRNSIQVRTFLNGVDISKCTFTSLVCPAMGPCHLISLDHSLTDCFNSIAVIETALLHYLLMKVSTHDEHCVAELHMNQLMDAALAQELINQVTRLDSLQQMVRNANGTYTNGTYTKFEIYYLFDL